MEIKLGGEFVVSKKPDDVYAFLVDPNRFCPLLPDYESLTIQDDKTFLVKLRVGISHIRGTAAMKLALADRRQCHAPRRIRPRARLGRHESPLERPGARPRADRIPRGRIARTAGQKEFAEAD